MACFENLTIAEQRNMAEMGERLDAHFDRAAFAPHRPVRYARLHTQISNLRTRREEMAFNLPEIVALHCAVFDLPKVTFQGDDVIVGLVKRYNVEIDVTPSMVKASYTFFQWLGTNVGQGFIRELQGAIKAHQSMDASEQIAQLSSFQDMLHAYFAAPSRCRQKPFNIVLDEQDEAAQHPSPHSLLALGTYLNLQQAGARPDTRNAFDYIMNEVLNRGHGIFFASDDDQVVAMSLVAWLGTEEGTAFLRFLDK